MAVGAERDVDAAVSHALHHRSGVCALCDEERCVGVAKVVESGSVGQTSSDDCWFEVARVPVGVSEWSAVGPFEDDVVLFLAGDVLGEFVGQRCRESESPSLIGLRGGRC